MKEEVEGEEEAVEWKGTMERSFDRMDKEVQDLNGSGSSSCRCDLQTPQCDAVGSTAVVAVVTPEKIIVSNCGDSRAVLCRNGVAIPLSSDHKVRKSRQKQVEKVSNLGSLEIFFQACVRDLNLRYGKTETVLLQVLSTIPFTCESLGSKV